MTRSFKASSPRLRDLLKNRLWLQILFGLFMGILTGFLLGQEAGLLPDITGKAIASWLALPGYVFLNLIQMIIIPLVLASVMRGIASAGDIDTVKTIGLRGVLYFLMTTTIAVTVGVTLASVIEPGKLINPDLVKELMSQNALPTGLQDIDKPQTDLSWPQRIAALLPTNPLAAATQGQMLALVIFAALFGTALICLPKEKSRPFIDLLASLQDCCMVIIGWAMRIAPFAVFGLMADIVQKIGFEALSGMAAYMLTVLGGLVAMLCVYMVLLSLLAKKNPITFLGNIRDVMILAFSTSSSAAVMPVSLKTAEENLKLKPHVSQFIIPLGVTINMDGTALYQAAATVFLAQIFGIDIGWEGLLIVLATSIGASVGTPGTPGVGIIILAGILMAVGVPPSGIALILGVDRILDMCRTTVNVTGDLVAASVMDRWVK